MSNINKKDENREKGNVDLLVEEKIHTERPKMYSVVILNDDYTPMEFVVYILENIFNKSYEEAKQIMLHIHRKGSGICGVYTFDVAETKAKQVIDFAKKNEHPLECKIKKA